MLDLYDFLFFIGGFACGGLFHVFLTLIILIFKHD